VYCARLLGQHIAPTEDPPIGSALPAFAGYLYLDNHIIDGKYQFVAERGITTGRHSVLQANVQKKDNIITEIQIGGQAIFASVRHLIFINISINSANIGQPTN